MMPYTGKESRIILSFANASGGDLFAHWLRDRLMKDLDYYSENAVFLDNIASRNAPGGKVAPDLRGKDDKYFDPTTGKTADGSYVSIGAQNKNWFKMWQTALKQAMVLIQVQTPEYFDSTACAQEMANISKELKADSKLEVLAITVDDTCAAMAVGPQPPHTTPMRLKKIPGTTDSFSPVKLLKDSWIISDSDFRQVSNFMKAYGCHLGF
jgi:hypothetical protein